MANIVICWSFVLGLMPIGIVQDDESELKSVTARNIELKIPKAWKPVEVTSPSRVAQFAIPNHLGDGEAADLIVYYFGGPTGGIKANVERWIGQFHEKDRDVKLVSGRCHSGRYVLVDIAGNWKQPVGPPVAGKTVDKPGSRVIGIILVANNESSEEYYFIKLSGPDELVKSQKSALRTAIGVDAESESPFELDDLEN